MLTAYMTYVIEKKILQVIIPEEAPLADDVDFERLAHYEMSGGNIKCAVFRAAARAALKEEGEEESLIYNYSYAVPHVPEIAIASY